MDWHVENEAANRAMRRRELGNSVRRSCDWRSRSRCTDDIVRLLVELEQAVDGERIVLGTHTCPFGRRRSCLA